MSYALWGARFGVSMSKLIQKFKAQTVYFKIAFVLTIIPITGLLIEVIREVILDQQDAKHGIPDSGLVTIFLVLYIAVVLPIYYVLLRICAIKNNIGIAVSVIVSAATVYIYIEEFARLTSGASK